MTQAIPLDIIEHEREFGHACQGRMNDSPCPNAAEWLAWCAHSYITCPGYLYCCTRCKELSEEGLARALRDGNQSCGVCRTRFSGLTSDHMRFIKL